MCQQLDLFKACEAVSLNLPSTAGWISNSLCVLCRPWRNCVPWPPPSPQSLSRTHPPSPFPPRPAPPPQQLPGSLAKENPPQPHPPCGRFESRLWSGQRGALCWVVSCSPCWPWSVTRTHAHCRWLTPCSAASAGWPSSLHRSVTTCSIVACKYEPVCERHAHRLKGLSLTSEYPVAFGSVNMEASISDSKYGSTS